MDKLKVGSLFAGIGGFDLGFERAGYEISWQVEIDPFCRKILAKHFPNAKRFEDVRNVGAANLDPVDVICGGFPCQDISVAGKGAGITGTRSGLWSEQFRIVSELRPRYVVVENVSALLARGMGRVLGDLSEIGYDAEWETISASQFGLPQKRKRIWIVAHPSGLGTPRLFQSLHPCQIGQRWAGGSANLFDIADSPFIGTDSFPQPLLRGVDDRPPHRVDRVRACGNAVVPQIPEWIAQQILKHESSR